MAGSFQDTEEFGPTNYEVERPEQRKTKQICCVNLLKKWKERENYLMDPRVVEEEWSLEIKGSQVPIIGTQIPKGGREQLEQRVREFKDVFTEVPGWAKGICHQIRTSPGQAMKDVEKPPHGSARAQHGHPTLCQF